MIKIAIKVVPAELLGQGIPILGWTIDNVEDAAVDDDLVKNSEKNNFSSFFLDFYKSSNIYHYQF